MNVRLADKTELEALGVNGRDTYYQGVSRDCLIFLFNPETVSYAEAREKFIENNCAAIEVSDKNGKYLYENYIIRIEMGEGIISQVLEGSVGQDTRKCVFVKMAQSTLAERKILEQQAAIDALVVAALEG